MPENTEIGPVAPERVAEARAAQAAWRIVELAANPQHVVYAYPGHEDRTEAILSVIAPHIHSARTHARMVVERARAEGLSMNWGEAHAYRDLPCCVHYPESSFEFAFDPDLPLGKELIAVLRALRAAKKAEVANG